MKELKFTETFNREDWEPLYGKWFIEPLEEPFFQIVLYKVIPTECGFVVYRLADGCQNEGHISYEKEYSSTDVPYIVCRFVCDFISDRLKPIDESRVEDAKNIMNELNDAVKAQLKSSEQYNDSLKNIKEKISSLL